MYDKTEEALDYSMELAIRFREKKGMRNPEDVSVRPYFERDRKITKVEHENGWIAYNVHGILLEAVRGSNSRASQKAREAMMGERDRDQVAAEIVGKWNEIFEEQHEKAISVSCIFHSLEEIEFRRSVPRKSDSIFEDFSQEVIAGKIRDELFRNMDSLSSKTENASKLPNIMAEYLRNNNDLPSPESYRKCHDLLDLLQGMDALELHRGYKTWKSPKAVIND